MSHKLPYHRQTVTGIGTIVGHGHTKSRTHTSQHMTLFVSQISALSLRSHCTYQSRSGQDGAAPRSPAGTAITSWCHALDRYFPSLIVLVTLLHQVLCDCHCCGVTFLHRAQSNSRITSGRPAVPVNTLLSPSQGQRRHNTVSVPITRTQIKVVVKPSVA